VRRAPYRVGPLFAQAIEDALDRTACGIEILEIPLSPGRLWPLLAKESDSGRCGTG